jgi:hypothetical protein
VGTYPQGQIQKMPAWKTRGAGRLARDAGAREFLNQFLSDGRKRTVEVIAAAEQRGVSAPALTRATKGLNVQKFRRGGFGRESYWEWGLPKDGYSAWTIMMAKLGRGQRRAPSQRRSPSVSGRLAEIATVMEYAIGHPDETRNAVALRHNYRSGSTIHGWCTRPGNGIGLRWFTEGDNLERWEASRPEDRLSPTLRANVLAQRHGAPALEPPASRVVEPTPVTEPALVVNAPHSFTPQASGDLLVVREDILTLQQSAERIATEARAVIIAIDTVRDWLDDREKLESALGRVQTLEAQLEAANRAIQTFQNQKIGNSLVVHSKD